MDKPRDPLSKSSERRAIKNCRNLLSQVDKNPINNDIWVGKPRNYMIVESINSCQSKEKKLQEDINKLFVALIAGIGTALTFFLIPPKFIPEVGTKVLGIAFGIVGIIFGGEAISYAVYKFKVKEYLKAVKDYLTNFNPQLLTTIEPMGNARVKKNKNK